MSFFGTFFSSKPSSAPVVRKLNLQPSPPDARDGDYAVRAVRSSVLPAAADIGGWVPKVKDQGSIGSCGSHAFASAVEILARRDRILWNDMPLSELWHYYTVRQLDFMGTYPEDSGQFLRDGAKVLQKRGIPPEELWPYKEADYNKHPGFVANAFSTLWKISSYNRVTSVSGMKTALAAAQPVVFGIRVYADVYSPGKTGDLKQKGLPAGGHALCAVGYDDEHVNPDGTKGAVRFLNSWGTAWGDKGYGWISYDLLARDWIEAWTIVL